MLDMARSAWGRPMFMEICLLASWSIWKEKNNKHFRGIPPTHHTWLARFKEDFALLQYRVKEEKKEFISSFLATI